MSTPFIDANKPKAAGTPRRSSSREIVISGQLALVNGVNAADRDNPRIALPEWVEVQVDKIFTNLDSIIELHELTRKDIVAVRVHLLHFERLLARMDHAYATNLQSVPHLPTRSCVGVTALSRQALVEMDFVLERKTP